MSTIKGFGFNEVKPQPGFSARKLESGGWTGNHSFAILRTAWSNASVRNQFAKGVAITAIDPDLDAYFSFMSVVESEVVSEEGDFIMVSVTIAGAAGATYGEGGLSDDADPTYRLNGQLQDAPLSQHRKWAALTDIEKQALGEMISQGLVFDPPTNKVGTKDERTFWAETDSDGTEYLLASADAILFAKLISKGETTYSRPTFTWTESAQGTDGLTSAQINALGNISTPRGSPPEPNGGRDWMLTSAFQETRGEMKTTDLEWTLSEKGGHDSFLYDE